MNLVSLDAFLDKYLDEKEAKAAKEKESQGTAVIRPAGSSATAAGDDSWYFYNSTAQVCQLNFRGNGAIGLWKMIGEDF